MNRKRIPPEIVCPIHGQRFVRFSYRNNQSYGCPQCVSELSERVRNERARMFGRRKTIDGHDSSDSGGTTTIAS
jgi:Protein of unknown function (DUF723)